MGGGVGWVGRDGGGRRRVNSSFKQTFLLDLRKKVLEQSGTVRLAEVT